MLTKSEITQAINTWLGAWDAYDLDGVLDLIHEDVIFENWTGQIIKGKSSLRRAWTPWFLMHDNFKFKVEDIFVDEPDQKALFRWQLEWRSLEPAFKGEEEIRRGVDVLHFQHGKIIKKLTYSKTLLIIDGEKVQLNAKPHAVK